MSRLDKSSRQREEQGRQRIEQEAWEMEHYGETERQGIDELDPILEREMRDGEPKRTYFY